MHESMGYFHPARKIIINKAGSMWSSLTALNVLIPRLPDHFNVYMCNIEKLRELGLKGLGMTSARKGLAQ